MGDQRRKMEEFKSEKFVMFWLYLVAGILIAFIVFSLTVLMGGIYQMNKDSAVAHCLSRGNSREVCEYLAR